MSISRYPKTAKPHTQDFTEYATQLIADWPPLTETQIVRLRSIFGAAK